MKKFLFKVLPLLVVIFLIAPQVVFASWWNPFSWNIFSFLFNPHPQVQTISTTTLSNQSGSKIIVTKKTKTNTTTSQPVQQQTPTFIAPPVQQNVLQQQPVVSNPSSNTTLCNGTYWNNCPAGENFVCPQNGSAYCEPSQQQQQLEYQQQQEQQQQQQAQYQQQVQAALQQHLQQQKTNQINALTSQYNAQFSALEQQIIDIKTQYYKDLALIDGQRTDLAEANGEKQNLLNKDNTLISQIQLQEQQLYLNYTSQVNAVQNN